MEFTAYDALTGKILYTGFTTTGLPDLSAEGWSAIEGEFDVTTQYLPSGVPTDRPVNDTAIDKAEIDADGVDQFTLSGYPTDATVTITGAINYSGTLSSGSDSFTTTIAGTYKVLVSKFPHRDKEFTVHAS